MKLTTVLFDLDGTLLPMDTDLFLKAYFGGLIRKFTPLGYSSEALVKSIWKSTGDMVANDGSCTNEEVFWRSFTRIFGQEALKELPVFEDFYRNEFQSVKETCGYTPMAAQTIAHCKELGLRVALATNPLFPALATHSRIRWAGMKPEDFELVTTYENSCACKPNLLYYREILEKLGLCPEECLMVGNDVDEDMIAGQLGMRVFLLTPCLINKQGTDIHMFPHGDFRDLLLFLEETVHGAS